MKRAGQIWIVALAVLLTGAVAGVPAASAATTPTSYQAKVFSFTLAGTSPTAQFDQTKGSLNLQNWGGDLFVTVSDPSGMTVAFLRLNNGSNGPLRVGTYANARRFAEGGRPGLDVSYLSRGCNQSNGWFEVRDIGFQADGTPNRLDLRFENSCGDATYGLTGEVRVNQPAPTGPVAMPATGNWPLTYVGPGKAVQDVPVRVGAGTLRRTLTAVTLTGADSTSFALVADACSGRTLQAGQGCDVKVRFAPKGPGPRMAGLRLADTAGRVTTVPLDGRAATGATSLTVSGPPGEFISYGRTNRLDSTGATAQGTSTSGVQIGFQPASGGYWVVTLRPKDGTRLVPGSYPGATPYTATTPMIDVTSPGRGCSGLGSFRVLQAVYQGPDDAVTHFRATFDFRCYEQVATGEVDYQAQADVTPPTAPTAVKAAAAGSQARLTWTRSADTSRTLVRAFVGDVAPTTPGTGIAVGSTTSGTVTSAGLKAKTRYSFALFAVDTAGNVSKPAVVRLTTGG